MVFAGGTMKPVSHLTQQLLPSLPPSRLAVVSCDHVVPAANVLALCVPHGPAGPAARFHFSFDRREDAGQAAALLQTLLNVSGCETALGKLSRTHTSPCPLPLPTLLRSPLPSPSPHP